MKFEEFYSNYCTGDIAYLQEHESILKLIYERNLEHYNSDIKKFNHALKEYHYRRDAGFSWTRSPEGWDFWYAVLWERVTDSFYELYPKIKTCKLD